MFRVNDTVFEVGDIVERWTPEKHWQYWTTIQHQWDADAATKLDKVHYRVVRGPKKQQIW